MKTLIYGASVGKERCPAGQACRDAHSYCRNDPEGEIAVIALSDGHGGAPHVRSGVGAELAVRVAKRELSRFLGERRVPLSSGEGLLEPALAELRGAVVKGWREAVDAHLAAHPVDHPSGLPLPASDLRLLYGTTLLSAGMVGRFTVILQIGDGNITAIKRGGEAVDLTLRQGEQIADETHSLCEEDARDRLGVRLICERFPMLLLTTDGVANALQTEEELKTLAVGLYESLRTEPQSFKRELTPLLRRLSRASGDDCTVCFAAEAEEETFAAFRRARDPRPRGKKHSHQTMGGSEWD